MFVPSWHQLRFVPSSTTSPGTTRLCSSPGWFCSQSSRWSGFIWATSGTLKKRWFRPTVALSLCVCFHVHKPNHWPLYLYISFLLLSLSSGARAGSLLAPVFLVPAAGAAVLPDRWRNHHPASRESRPLAVPPLPARSDPGLLPGSQDHDPKAHPALPSATVWQSGELPPCRDEPRVRAAVPPQCVTSLTQPSYRPLK